jgi:hypothetical protein
VQASNYSTTRMDARTMPIAFVHLRGRNAEVILLRVLLLQLYLW